MKKLLKKKKKSQEKQISKEIAELNELKSGLQAKWEAEKSHVDAIQQAKQEIENLKLMLSKQKEMVTLKELLK